MFWMFIKTSTGARPTVETFSCVMCNEYMATAAMRPLKVAGCDVRGVALDTDLGHYCSLFPVGQLPNFAGDNALGRWD
jgi:hypothetical protein